MFAVRRIDLAGLALALAAGCSESPPTGTSEGSRRIVLNAAPTDEPLRVERIEIPEDIGDWKISRGQARIARDVERGDGTRAYCVGLLGEGPKELHIPVHFDASAFNRVVLAVSTPSAERMWLQLGWANGSARSSAVATLTESAKPQLVRFYMPRKRLDNEPFEELVIVAAGISDYVIIHSIELSYEPLAHWTFGTDGGGERVVIRNQARPAKLVASSAPLSGTVEVGPDDQLAFSIGVPRVFRNPAVTPATLRLKATAEDGTRREWNFRIEELAATPGWRSERVALAGLETGQLEIEFALDVPQGVDLACFVAEARVVSPRLDPPTVLLITSDTHRGDHLGVAARGVEVSTPVLDNLAARGVLFEDCFTSTNTTNPSHIALMTSFHPRDTGILTNNTPLAEAAPTLAEVFRKAGYRTFAAISTRHLGDPTSGLGQGFDRMSWPGASERSAAESVEVIANWIPDAQEQPLFLWLHLFDAHIPYEPPSEFSDRYYPAGRDAFDPALAELTMPPARVLHESLAGLKDPEYPSAMYRAEISALDDALAAVLAQPRLSEAIVAFTADHGESLGQHGIFYSHGDLYPDSIHVPLILAYPGAAGGTRVGSPTSQTDVGRTLLDLAGEERADFPGRNLLSATEGSVAATAPRFALAGNATSASLTHDGWHLMLHLRPHFEPPRLRGAEWHQVELYKLDEDPGCTVDVADRRHEKASVLRARLVRWLTSARDLGWARERNTDPQLLAELARLGYTGQQSQASGRELFDPDCECERCGAFD